MMNYTKLLCKILNDDMPYYFTKVMVLGTPMYRSEPLIKAIFLAAKAQLNKCTCA